MDGLSEMIGESFIADSGSQDESDLPRSADPADSAPTGKSSPTSVAGRFARFGTGFLPAAVQTVRHALTSTRRSAGSRSSSSTDRTGGLEKDSWVTRDAMAMNRFGPRPHLGHAGSMLGDDEDDADRNMTCDSGRYFS